jgi:hypothetical protein
MPLVDVLIIPEDVRVKVFDVAKLCRFKVNDVGLNELFIVFWYHDLSFFHVNSNTSLNMTAAAEPPNVTRAILSAITGMK